MKILLTGFFGESNLGDEAILRAIYCSVPSEHQLVLTCGKKASISGPKMIARCGLSAWAQYLQAAKECDKAIFSGGILQDWTFEGITFFALRILAASIFKAEPTLWGAGVGPIRRLAGQRLAAKALSRVKTAWLRDQESADFFTQISGKHGNLGTDWTWYFDLKKTAMAFSHAPIGLNLREWPYARWQKDIEIQMKHIDRQVIGIIARPSDQAAIRQFAQGATILTPDSFSALSELCQNLSYGIAMRYHVALAMIRSGVPVKLVAYDSKVENLARDAEVELMSKNNLGGFLLAKPEFETENQQRFLTMQTAFREFLKQ